MKKIFTLCALALLAVTAKSQVVLNEVYTDPGSGNSEFFEFYNTSTSPIPESMDNYTLIAYYEESGKTGFYVLDLPAVSIASKGYFVGASATTYNVQAQTGLTSDFNWNSISGNAFLKKFERSGFTYTNVAVPANINDIFVKRTGAGAVQHVMVFKNGLLVNGIFTGTNAAIIPSYIKSMPPLYVDMTGASIDFTINFNSFNDNQFEYVTAVAGSDNGYIRLNDGKCGVWDKSSTAASHTPGKSNGSATGVSGELTITAYITELTGDPEKALLVYNVGAASLAAFPVTIEVYKDLGMTGELDAADLLVDSRILNTIPLAEQYVILPFRTEPVMIVAKTPSGCFDQVLAVSNSLAPLPVNLISFMGNMNKSNKVTLTWVVADNETVNRFEVERSVNGKDFTTAGIVFGSEKFGNETYMFFETVNNTDKVMYRLKMIDKGNDVDYSKILVFQSKASASNTIKVIGNPVNDKLSLSYSSSSTQVVDVKVYDMSGRMVMANKVNSLEGNNMISLPLNSTFKAGMYVVEVNNGTDRQTTKFVKQ
jgi:hypothetical protein